MNGPDDLRFQPSEPRIHGTAELKACKLGRYASVGERTILREVTVGDFTYFERHAEAIYSDIGKFCSIAANTRINALEHPLERVTTHKVSYRPNEYFRYLGVDKEFRERRRQKRVTIGHDVWIGHGAVVMPGVNIGNGAVVGAGAVVTGDVAAYAIVAGMPARVIRPRFPTQVVERLQEMEWWNWPLDKLFQAIPDMQELEILQFIEKWSD
jgi:phosphonate metabolism protein (transferase hexapeptide repeat family)